MRVSWPLAPLLLLLAAGCSHPGMRMNAGVAEPEGRHFLDFPERYKNRVVRLEGLEATRIEIRRPLVFTTPGNPEDEVVIHDSRSLARTGTLRPGEVVTILIDCTEGRTDRGNLLLAIERLEEPDGTTTAPGPESLPVSR